MASLPHPLTTAACPPVADPAITEFHGDGVCIVLLPAAAYSVSGAADHHGIGLALARQTGVHRIGGERRRDFDTLPSTLAYTPAGMPMFSESPVGGEYLLLQWTPQAWAQWAGDIALPSGRPQAQGQRAAMRTAIAARRALLAGSMSAETSATLAAQWLAACVPALMQKAVRRDDAPLPQAAALLDYIEAHLDTSLPLSALAAQVGLPVVSFLRAFERRIGMTPHAYVMERRLQRARQLLRTSRQPLAWVAAECGFAHQSHMGSVFQRVLGMPPSRYRTDSTAPPISHPADKGSPSVSDQAFALYVDSRFTSPWAMSVFVALTEKGLPFTLHTVDLDANETKTPAFAKLSLTRRWCTAISC